MSAIPAVLDWQALDFGERARILRRPARAQAAEVQTSARQIIDSVRSDGDAALIRFTREFDRVTVGSLEVRPDELAAAERVLDATARSALDVAIENVRRFHAAQRLTPLSIETSVGVRCERFTVPIRSVGLYVPAGSAPLPSTAIMLAVPAEIAECTVRVLATPPRTDGGADPAVLYVARRCGVQRIFKMGGAQAIAALAYGTSSIPKVDKIFGPGNAWVTAAKQIVATDPEGAACDLPAGPSEVLVIADASARADFVAADLLAQAEHSPDAQALLITDSRALAEAVRAELERQVASLSRHDILRQSLATSRLVFVPDLATALELSNTYAPEHLILEITDARAWLGQVTAAGSVFLGAWSPETMGDYCSGTNHVLPTYGYARAFSGLSLQDFTRQITVQELTPAGLRGLGPTAQRIAQLEGLDAHARAVGVRLDALAAQGAT
jgi:histidinol dehydrogenase